MQPPTSRLCVSHNENANVERPSATVLAHCGRRGPSFIICCNRFRLTTNCIQAKLAKSASLRALSTQSSQTLRPTFLLYLTSAPAAGIQSLARIHTVHPICTLAANRPLFGTHAGYPRLPAYPAKPALTLPECICRSLNHTVPRHSSTPPRQTVRKKTGRRTDSLLVTPPHRHDCLRNGGLCPVDQRYTIDRLHFRMLRMKPH